MSRLVEIVKKAHRNAKREKIQKEICKRCWADHNLEWHSWHEDIWNRGHIYCCLYPYDIDKVKFIFFGATGGGSEWARHNIEEFYWCPFQLEHQIVKHDIS